MTHFFVGPWLVETPINRLSCDSRVIHLEPKVLNVLLRLSETPGEVVSKEELINSVWCDTFVSEDVLTRSISQLRKVFDDDARQPRFIETISRKGYRLIALVRQVEGDGLALQKPVPSGNDLGPDPYSSRIKSAALWRLASVAAILAVTAVGCFLVLRARVRSSPHLTHATIVVLPFVNLSGNPAEEYFSDGMTEEMIAALSQAGNQSLGVIARTSAMRYKNSGKGVEQISRELQANYVLEGSVRRSGDRVRVTVQLIQAQDQTHLWADNYDAELKDVLGVQAQISEAVAQAIRVKLAERKIIPPSVDPGAYQLYLKGRYFLDRSRSPEGLRKALSYFQQAVQRDPSFARGWANVALSYELLEYVHDMSPREAHPYALAGANRAIQFDPFSAEGHLAMAYIHEHYEWNWTEANRELAHAMHLDPNFELARQWLSYGLLQRGDVEGALVEMRRAFALDPFSQRVNITLAMRMDRVGKPEAAIRQLREAVDLEPGNPVPHFELSRLYFSRHEFEKAADEELHALQLDNNLEAANHLKSVWKKRDAEEACEQTERRLLDAELRDLDARSRRGEYVSPADYAWAYTRLRDPGNTLRWLQRAFDEHATILLELRTPEFDFVRDAPQFQEWVRLVAMPTPPTRSK
jgi:TolB-like protein/DNA-binding winged helix-turn-helix (wHTH) protein